MRRYSLKNFFFLWKTNTTSKTILIPSTIIHENVQSVKKYDNKLTVKHPTWNRNNTNTRGTNRKVLCKFSEGTLYYYYIMIKSAPMLRRIIKVLETVFT